MRQLLRTTTLLVNITYMTFPARSSKHSNYRTALPPRSMTSMVAHRSISISTEITQKKAEDEKLSSFLSSSSACLFPNYHLGSCVVFLKLARISRREKAKATAKRGTKKISLTYKTVFYELFIQEKEKKNFFLIHFNVRMESETENLP